MFNFLENIRSKPVAIRKRYAIGFCLVVMLLLTSVWGIVHVSKVRASNQNVVVNNDPSPFEALSQNISEGYKQVTESISGSNPFTANVNTATAEEVQPTSSVATNTPESIQPSFDQVIISDVHQ